MNIPLDRPARILVIDDDPLTHALIGAILRSVNAEVFSADEGSAGLQRAREVQPDLILLDYDMPGMDGLQVKRALDDDDALYSIPVVFATGADDNKVLSACFVAGADDYVRKPLCAPELRARLGSVIQRRVLGEQMSRLAHQDMVTGLLNRPGLQARLETALGESDDAHPGAVVFLDVDGFRTVNDTHGQAFGDLVLGEVGGRLRDQLERGDGAHPQGSVGRLGSDAFGLVLQRATVESARRLAGELVAAFHEPLQVQDRSVSVTVSVGLLHLEAGMSLDKAFAKAEVAMRQASRDGGDQVAMHEPATAVAAG